MFYNWAGHTQQNNDDGELIDQTTLDRRYGQPRLRLTARYAVGVNRSQYEDLLYDEEWVQ